MRVAGPTAAGPASVGSSALDGRPDIEIPRNFLCPIVATLMRDPVSAADGHSYERAAITKWLKDNGTSPSTNLPLKNRRLVRNHALRGAIDAFVSTSLASTPPMLVARDSIPLSTPLPTALAAPGAAVIQDPAPGFFARIFRALFPSAVF